MSKIKNSKFIPQSLVNTLIGKTAGYALTKGDHFGAITFLCEGVYPQAFYYDPASGGKRGILVNTHPGITLSLQREGTIRKIFSNTSLAGMTDEIVSKSIGNNRGISPNMKAAKLKISDYYNMFKMIQGNYSDGVKNALKARFNQHPLAEKLIKQGFTKDNILTKIQSSLPPSAYAVLQQLAYKYGTGGIKHFGKLLDNAINAGLDPEHQDAHLANGAKYIVYQYMNKNKQWVQDTRVMNIHRLFFTSGQKFSPELNLKLITGKTLDEKEENIVKNVAQKAGVSSIVKNGKLDLPDSTLDTIKQSNPDNIHFNTNAINKGVTTVEQHYISKPVDVPKHINHISENILKPSQHLDSPIHKQSNVCSTEMCLKKQLM